MTRARLTLLGDLRSTAPSRFAANRDRKRRRHRLKRGVYLLPSVFTLANMLCGYACLVFAIRGQYAVAAPFVGFALVLDMLDGRIARLTGTETAFGLQFDSLADVISFGVAPAILAYLWGLEPLGRVGLAGGFIFLTGAAMRLARFNLQALADKRYFVGMPSPAAAAVPAATVFAFPGGPENVAGALAALAVLVVPGLLMVSRLRYYSFKTIDLQQRRSQQVVVLIALVFVAIVVQPRSVFLVLSYCYLVSGPVSAGWNRFKRWRAHGEAGAEQPRDPELRTPDSGLKTV